MKQKDALIISHIAKHGCEQIECKHCPLSHWCLIGIGPPPRQTDFERYVGQLSARKLYLIKKKRVEAWKKL